MRAKLINAMQKRGDLTENQAVTHASSGSALLDLFFKAGAARSLTEGQIRSLIASAYKEDHILTRKLIFWAGDIRGGAGGFARWRRPAGISSTIRQVVAG